MNPDTGEYATLEELKGMPAEKAELFSVEVNGAEEDVERLSAAVRESNSEIKFEALYQGAMAKLRNVRAIGKSFARSGNPARKAAGEAILGELE